MKITRLLTQLIIALIAVSHSYAAPTIVDNDDLTFVSISTRQTAACYEGRAGTVRISKNKLRFESYKEAAKRLSGKKRTRVERLRKAFRKSCRSETGTFSYAAAPALGQDISNAALPLSYLVSPFASLRDSLPGATAVDLALARAQIKALGEQFFSCAAIEISGVTVTVNFGPDCTVGEYQFAGSVTIEPSLTIPSASLALAVTFGSFSVNGITIDGLFTTSAASGAGLSLKALITVVQGSETSQLSFDGTAVYSAPVTTFNATGSVTSGFFTGNFTVTDVTSTSDGSCYPNGGSIAIDPSSSPVVTVSFSTATPTSGVVTVRVGVLEPTEETLSACPFPG